MEFDPSTLTIGADAPSQFDMAGAQSTLPVGVQPPEQAPASLLSVPRPLKMNRRPLTYSEINDEYLQHLQQFPTPGLSLADYARTADSVDNQSLREAAYAPDFGQRMNDWIDRNVFTLGGTGIGLGVPNPLMTAPPSQRVAPVAGEMTAPIGGAIDRLTGNKTGAWEQSFKGFGEGFPRGMSEAMLLGNPLTTPIGLSDAFLSGYGPEGSTAGGVINAVTMGVGAKAIPGAGNLAERAFVRGMMPGAEEIAALPSREYGAALAKLMTNTPSTALKTGAALARTGGSVAAGTGVFEAARQAQGVTEGRGLTWPTPQEATVNFLNNFMFAPNEFLKTRSAPFVPEAARLAQEAGIARARNINFDAQRGQRLADIHQQMFNTIKEGGDPTAWLDADMAEKADAVEQRKGELPAVDPVAAVHAASEQANQGGMSQVQIADVISALSGRFDERAQQLKGPMDISAAALDQLVKQGHLPRVDDNFLRTNFGEAYDQAVGNEQLAWQNLLNRVDQWYQERVPGALEARQAQPQAPGMFTKYELDLQSERDRMEQYMAALWKLYPSSKDAVGPRGEPLFNALQGRDVDITRATTDQQFNAVHEWDQYDAWRDAVIQLADTYDPVTRSGMVAIRRRAADGSIIQGRAKPTTIEDLVAGTPVGKEGWEYSYKLPLRRVTRERGGKSTMEVSSLDEMLNYIADKEAGREVDEENPPATVAETEGLPSEEAKLATHRAAKETGQPALEPVVPREDEAALSTDTLGVNLGQANDTKAYDAAAHIAAKVDQMANVDLWQEYGQQVFPGKSFVNKRKAQTFKQALMAKLEYDIGEGTLTTAGREFVDAWKKSSPGEMKGWDALGEKQQLTRALAEYFKGVPKENMKGLFLEMLADRPQYQQYLRTLGQAKTAAPAALGPVEQRTFPEDSSRMVATGFQEPVIDTGRLFRGWALKAGFDSQYADEFSTLAMRMTQAFPEVKAVGRLTNLSGAQLGDAIAKTLAELNLQGLNFDTARGITALVNFDILPETTQETYAASFRFLQVLAHELTHAYTNLEGRDLTTSAFSRQRNDAYNTLWSTFKLVGNDVSASLLNDAMYEIMIPQEFRTRGDKPLVNSPDEAISRLMEHIALGAFTRGSKYQTGRPAAQEFRDAVLHAPDEVQAFMNMAYRDIANYSSAMKDYLSEMSSEATRMSKDPENRGEWSASYKDDSKRYAQMANALDGIIRHAESFLGDAPRRMEYQQVAQSLINKLNAGAAADWTDPKVVYSANALDKDLLSELARSPDFAASVKDVDINKGFRAAREAQTAMFGADPEKVTLIHERELGTTTPKWSKWMGTLYQHFRRYEVAGNPLAAHAAWMIQELEPAYGRVAKLIRAPFMTTNPRGQIVYDPDHPVQLILQNKHAQSEAARRSINDLVLRANESHEALVTRQPDGKLEASETVKARIKNFAPVVQQGILEGLAGLTKGYKTAADLIYADQVERAGAQVAKTFMLMDRSIHYESATEAGRQAIVTGVDALRTRMALANEQKKLNIARTEGGDVGEAEAEFAQAQKTFTVAQAKYDATFHDLDPDLKSAFETYAFGGEGIAQRLMDLDDAFKAREGWFTSEARPGRYLVISKTPDGTKAFDSARTMYQVKLRQRQLAELGHTDFVVKDKTAAKGTAVFDTPDAIIDSFMDTERAAWQKFAAVLKERLGDEGYKALAEDDGLYVPGEATSKLLADRSIAKYLRPQKKTPGRERLDAFDVFEDYSRRIAATISRRSLRNQVSLLLRDPRVRNQGEFQQTVNNAVAVMLTPTNGQWATTRAAITSYFMGLPNFTAPIIEASQQLSTIQPYLIWQGDGVLSSFARLGRALTQVHGLDVLTSTFEGRSLLARANAKVRAQPGAMTKQESLAYYYHKALEDGVLTHGVAQDLVMGRDQELLAQQALGTATAGPKSKAELAKNFLYWASRATMIPYTKLTTYNNKSAMVTMLDLMYDQGMRGTELYNRAQNLMMQSTFGGGSQNEIGYVRSLPEMFTNSKLKSSAKIILLLQRYTLGYTTMMKDMVADAVGKTNLPPAQRLAALKAASAATISMAALGGAMAVPGFGLMTTVLEKWFGIDAKQAVRRFFFNITHALSDDDVMASTVSNIAMNGVSGQMFGLDLSGRIAVNGILGFNEYDGFNAGDLFGVPYGLVEGAVNATQYASQGNMLRAGRSIAPPSMQKMIDLGGSYLQHGAAGEYSQTGQLLLKTTPYENAMLSIGVAPYRYRQFRDMQHSMQLADQNAGLIRGQGLDDAAGALLRNDPKPTFEWVKKVMANDASLKPADIVRSVIDRAIKATNEKDLLATGMAGNDATRLDIAQTYGTVSRQSELKQTLERERLNALTGYQGGKPVTSRQLQRAALIDAFVKERDLLVGRRSV